MPRLGGIVQTIYSGAFDERAEATAIARIETVVIETALAAWRA